MDWLFAIVVFIIAIALILIFLFLLEGIKLELRKANAYYASCEKQLKNIVICLAESYELDRKKLGETKGFTWED